MATPIDFSKFAMNHLKLDKITKANLVGHVYQPRNGTCKSRIEQECPYSLSKPLPLQGSPGHLTIPVYFFFNNDLEYSRTGNSERKYTVSITKTKSVRLSRPDVFSTIKILSVFSVNIDKQLGYGYLQEIVVRRADRKLYTFKEGDFPRLHLNDIEDMLLLNVQNKLLNLDGDEIVDLVVALLVGKKDHVEFGRIGWWKNGRDRLQATAANNMILSYLGYLVMSRLTIYLNIRVILHSIHSDDGNPSSANIKQELREIVTYWFTLIVLSAVRHSDNKNKQVTMNLTQSVLEDPILQAGNPVNEVLPN
ncbi:hypothetical protein Tco_0501012 [Tanacetum coccineum]